MTGCVMMASIRLIQEQELWLCYGCSVYDGVKAINRRDSFGVLAIVVVVCSNFSIACPCSLSPQKVKVITSVPHKQP